MSDVRGSAARLLAVVAISFVGCVDDGDASFALMEEDQGQQPHEFDTPSSLADETRDSRIVAGFGLSIEKAGADIDLAWVEAGAGPYEVWISDDPLFEPTDPGSTLLAGGIVDDDYTHVGGNDFDDRFYRVRAVGAAQELSTTVGMNTTAWSPEYTPMALCLVSDVDSTIELATDLESPMNGTHIWDAAIQGWSWAWGTQEFNAFSFGPGQAVGVSHYGQDPVTPPQYTMVGLVPTADDVAVPLLPGINVVTTVHHRFPTTLMASTMLPLIPDATRVGLWDPDAQQTQWYPENPDFAIPPCRAISIDMAVGGGVWPELVLPLPESCADIVAGDPTATDGLHTLFFEGEAAQPWTAYCDDMAGTPAEYLEFPNSGPELNFSEYEAGGPAPGTTVRTNFTRVRVDPITLVVDLDDLSFSSSTGSLLHGNVPVESMPYGFAMGCNFGNAVGNANIDLTGTPFIIDSPFCQGGFIPFGTVDVDPTAQVVDLTGGGFCGWSGPSSPCSGSPQDGTSNTQIVLAYGGCGGPDITGCPAPCTDVFYADADGDGFGDAQSSVVDCSAPAGFVSDDTDCDDTDAAVNPGQAEIQGDGVDNDCDPSTMDEVAACLPAGAVCDPFESPNPCCAPNFCLIGPNRCLN